MAGLIVFLCVMGFITFVALIAFLNDRTTRNHEVRKKDLQALKSHVSRAEVALDDVELALDSYAGLDIVGAALAQDVRNIVRNHRQDMRKIEEKRNK